MILTKPPPTNDRRRELTATNDHSLPNQRLHAHTHYLALDRFFLFVICKKFNQASKLHNLVGSLNIRISIPRSTLFSSFRVLQLLPTNRNPPSQTIGTPLSVTPQQTNRYHRRNHSIPPLLLDVGNLPGLERTPSEPFVVSRHDGSEPKNDHVGEGILLTAVGLWFGTPVVQVVESIG